MALIKKRIENIDYPAFRELDSMYAAHLGKREVSSALQLTQYYANPSPEGNLAGLVLRWAIDGNGENDLMMHVALRHADDASLKLLQQKDYGPHITSDNEAAIDWIQSEEARLHGYRGNYIIFDSLDTGHLEDASGKFDISQLPEKLKEQFKWLSDNGVTDAGSLEALHDAVTASTPQTKKDIVSLLRPSKMLGEAKREWNR